MSNSYLLTVTIIGIIEIISLALIFRKAGQPGWAVVVPIYGTIVWFRVIGKPWWWLILGIIPIVNIVVILAMYYDLSKVFGKGAGVGFGLVFLPFIFLPILAFGDARYLGSDLAGDSGIALFLLRRLMAAIPVMFAIILVTFVLSHLLPGGPFDAVGDKQMPEYMVRQLERKFGLNKPLLINTWNDGYYPDGDDWKILGYHQETKTIGGGPGGEVIEETEDVLRVDLLDSQFFSYIWGVTFGGPFDFGPSLNRELRDHNVMVKDEIQKRLPVSMQIGVFAVILGFALGVPLGVLAAVYHNTAVDYAAMFFAVLNQATPAIVLAPILIIIFAVELGWVPVADTQNQWQDGPEFSLYYLQILALPVITLGTGMSAGIARLTRASLLQVLNEDYVRTARAKGLRERVVIYVHALKNALIPVATILGPLVAGVLTGTFVIELIFVIPGLGEVFVNSVTARDYTMIMGVSILYSVFLILGNIMVDVMYTWLDPRIRFD